MSLVDRLRQHRQLRASAAKALQSNLPLLQAPLASLPSITPERPYIRPLDDEYLKDLWPDELRNPQSERHIKLRNDFRWIADVAGHKLHQLEHTRSNPPQRVQAHAQIVEEARTFAAVAAGSVVGRLPTHPVPDDDPDDAAKHGDPDPSTEPLPVGGACAQDDGPQHGQEQLDQFVAFVARQEPHIAWAVGSRSDGSTVLACDIAFGWIPPRVALPTGVDLLAPASRSHAEVEDLLGDVVRTSVYSPGATLAEVADVLSSSGPRAKLTCSAEEFVKKLADDTGRRIGIAPAVKALINAAAARRAIAATGRIGVFAYVDAARRQLFSDYPLLDESFLGDCMLMCAIESCLTGDYAAATYHHAWFEALYGGSPDP